MRQILTLELSEKVFAAIQQQAETIGMAPESLAATLLEKQFSQTIDVLSNDDDREVARAKFEGHFGTLQLDSSIDLSNDSIDDDLAREYAGSHEE